MISSNDGESRDNRVDAKLRSIAKASFTKPFWYEAWQKLGPEAPDEERLAVYQAARDSGLLPDEAGSDYRLHAL
ncbi:MAG: hypothetical protein ABIK89_08140 [Planctomycetota bacterium]